VEIKINNVDIKGKPATGECGSLTPDFGSFR
jgi:hypothetical protein